VENTELASAEEERQSKARVKVMLIAVFDLEGIVRS
jgi:hypothetical protein